MGRIFVTSDLHLRHHNMAVNYRGFSSSEEHDATIIENWNKIITKKDTVWILGDINMEKGNYSDLLLLNGIKKVVGGNHDQPQHARNMLEYVNGICGVYQYKNAWLTHMPIHPSELLGNEINIHGHCHKDVKILDPRYINVSIDYREYKPVLLESILNGTRD